MKKTIVVTLCAVAFGIFYQWKIKPEIALRAGKALLKHKITSVCNRDPKCEARYAPFLAHLDECFTLESVKALNTPRQKEEETKTAQCVQKSFLKDRCKNGPEESRCLASVASYFDACYSVAMTTGKSSTDPQAFNSLITCVDEKAGTPFF